MPGFPYCILLYALNSVCCDNAYVCVLVCVGGVCSVACFMSHIPTGYVYTYNTHPDTASNRLMIHEQIR